MADANGPVLRALAVVGRVLGLVAFVVILLAAPLGEDDPATNLAPVGVYAIFWVGLIFVSGIVGDVWRVMSPFDTLALGWEKLRRRRGEEDFSHDEPRADGEDPTEHGAEGGPDEDMAEEIEEDEEEAAAEFGYWPAAAGLAAFVWVELVFPERAQPRVLFFLMAGYSLAMLTCAAAWGREWLRRGEAFGAFFRILSHIAPLHRDDEGRLLLRAPFAGLATLRPERGLEAVVLVALGSTSFDGLTRTQFWLDLTGDMSESTVVLVATLVLAWAVAVVGVAYVGAMRLASQLVGTRLGPAELRAAFIHSLVPIALAYAVAHYFSLLVLEGQAAIALISDPLGRGWDLFGTAGRDIDFGLVSPQTVAYVQAAAIVIGHVAGVVVAHDRALVLAHGGGAGLAFEAAFLAVPVLVVGVLSLLSRRKKKSQGSEHDDDDLAAGW